MPSIWILLFLLFSTPTFAQILRAGPPSKPPTTMAEIDEEKNALNLTKYEAVYFAYAYPTSKLQFSFKYQLIEKIPVYFGYTQVLFWNLGQDSQPFKDVNYGPEVFHHLEIKSGALESIDLAPYAHLSNGRDGAASRTINRAYARFNFQRPLSEGTLRLAATVFAFYGLSSDNGDIYKYVGPIDLKFTVTQFIPWVFDKGEFTFRIFPGGSYAERWDRGGQEAGLSFRFGLFGIRPSFYLLYYNGYAESLLDYNQVESSFRFGVIL